MNNYKYDHIIHLLLNKHGWVRVPFYVNWVDAVTGKVKIVEQTNVS